MPSTTTLEGSIGQGEHNPEPALEASCVLVVVWASEPERIGQVLLVEEGVRVFGRGPAAGDEVARVELVRQRPAVNEPCEPIENPFLSRHHLGVRLEGEAGVRVENLGKRALSINGAEVSNGVASEGDIVEIRGLLTFLCQRRPRVLPRLELLRYPLPAFGQADRFGIVGESPLAWELRDRIAFFGARSAHVLVTGASGTGKELAAQAIHALSSRHEKKMVSRNAATLPAGLIDAELFGNAASYPQASMPERPGLVGEAHESTLFLDEIGELPVELQTHLLRVLDDGEYQRLGEAKRRRAEFRLVAATNRSPTELKPDVLARLALRLEMPDLNARREDMVLIARHVLRRIAARDPDLGARFFSGWDGSRGEPRLGADLARALVTHTYTSHVRELEALLWLSLSTSRGGFADLTDAVRAELARSAPPESAVASEPRTSTPSPNPSIDELRASMARHDGVRERVWRDLGLPSRHALHRLLKKYGLGDGGDPLP